MGVREEFYKEFETWLENLTQSEYDKCTPKTCALWAAQWMVERCSKEVTEVDYRPFVEIDDFDDAGYLKAIVHRIDRLAKELSQGAEE